MVARINGGWFRWKRKIEQERMFTFDPSFIMVWMPDLGTWRAIVCISE